MFLVSLCIVSIFDIYFREEHKSHASYCQFVILNKDESKITFQEMHQLEMHQTANFAVRATSSLRNRKGILYKI